MLRWIAALFLVLLVAVGISYFVAARGTPPRLAINKPERVIGQTGTLDVTAEAPQARFETLTIELEQNGRVLPLFSLAGAENATIAQPSGDALRITRPLGKQSVPELQTGPARVVVTASRKSFLGLRTLQSSVSRDLQVRLEPPRLAVVSTHHYINHGGSEMVVYRTTPADVRSGVRVGAIEYPGFPAAGAGVTSADPSLNVAFFSLLYDQDLNTPIVAFAEDEAGNQAKASFMDNVFEKPFKKSRIEIDDKFLRKVITDISEGSPELKISNSPNDDELVSTFLKINGEVRRENTDEIQRIGSTQTSPRRLWELPFVQLGNSQVEARFADHRTYVYKGREIDQQVHLGFDLAVTANVPVAAANAGKVLHASRLGIYGNCIIIDHGMGVTSLYGHLSSFDVGVGDSVTRGQTIGRSGMTGLAGGDHLHFTMLVDGRMVNPVEWWDPHWIQDRVDRKLREASSPTQSASAAQPTIDQTPKSARQRGSRPAQRAAAGKKSR
jgi:murein DD-endopeptidase MepM/ murein hydrolase activator NlpD